MCSLPESERPADLPPGMMEKILISSSGEPLVQAGSEDIPAKESMVTDAVMMAELEGITPASGYDGEEPHESSAHGSRRESCGRQGCCRNSRFPGAEKDDGG